MAPVGRAAIAPPQMRPPQMMGPPAGMMQGNYFFFFISNECPKFSVAICVNLNDLF